MLTSSEWMRVRLAGASAGCWCLLVAASAGAQLQTIGSVFLGQNSPGVAGAAELGDLFGQVLAAGNFNCDGFADLAVGVPWEDDGAVVHAGAINVFYGGPAGLVGAELWKQGSAGVPGDVVDHDHFGTVLAAFKSSISSCRHLAVGAPDEDINGTVTHLNAGAVTVFRGTASGLTPDGVIVQGRDGVPESPEDNDHFGAAISQGPPVDAPFISDCLPGQSGDLTLVISAPNEGLGLFDNGDGTLVQVVMPCDGDGGGGELPTFMTCAGGAIAGPCRDVNADDFDLPASLDPYDQFGESLALIGRGGVGGLPQTAWEFLAVGIPSANQSGGESASIGAVLEADPSWGAGSDYWTQDTSGVLGVAESADNFGAALAAGDFDDDGRPDLAIGVPFEDDGTTSNAGAVQVLRNSASGLTATGDFLVVQGDLFAGESEAGDHFGTALAAGDFDGDGVMDLAVGAPGENLPAPHLVTDAGAIDVLYGVAGTGVTTAGAQQFDADDLLFNAAFTGDAFGRALAAGDFDGNGVDDLAIGIPGPDDGSDTTFGSIAVLYGTTGGALGALDWVDGTPTVQELLSTINVQVTRTGSAVVALNIGFSTVNGTATAGLDFTATSGTISWAAGELGTKNVPVQILADTLDENNESFTLHLTGGGGAVTRPADATVTILDNDTAGSLQFSAPVFTVSESGATATITVTRSGGSASGVAVHYATANGTATAGQDYTATAGDLTYGFGVNSRAFSVPIADDSDPEPGETVALALSTPTGGATLGVFATSVLVILPSDGFIFGDGFESGTTSAWSATVP